MDGTDDNIAVNGRAEARASWRRIFFLETEEALEAGFESSGFESTATNATEAVADAPMDRVAAAREAMRRVIKDRFGGDTEMLRAVDQIALSGEEALRILADETADDLPDDEQGLGLEAIVAFDGSRPSFLIHGGRIDFDSSYNTETWRDRLRPFEDQIVQAISCVGRVEIGQNLLGTAFLVTPTLAVTNRHVADLIAVFRPGEVLIRGDVFVDFGREDPDYASHDRHKVEDIVFAGPMTIGDKINHDLLDLAVLQLSAPRAGNKKKERLELGGAKPQDFAFADIVATVGYPTGPKSAVPKALQSQHAAVLVRLLEGVGGAKRFAPGRPSPAQITATLPAWTAAHDATTLKGNSGSPLLVLNGADTNPLRAAGLHYGGRWKDERVNWAHLLELTGSTVGHHGKSFAEFCKYNDLALLA